MAKDKQQDKKAETPIEKKPLATKKYPLIADVKVGDKDMKSGDSISLTENGRVYMKSIHKIK